MTEKLEDLLQIRAEVDSAQMHLDQLRAGRDKVILALAKQGLPQREIADAAGVTDARIRQLLAAEDEAAAAA